MMGARSSSIQSDTRPRSPSSTSPVLPRRRIVSVPRCFPPHPMGTSSRPPTPSAAARRLTPPRPGVVVVDNVRDHRAPPNDDDRSTPAATMTGVLDAHIDGTAAATAIDDCAPQPSSSSSLTLDRRALKMRDEDDDGCAHPEGDDCATYPIGITLYATIDADCRLPRWRRRGRWQPRVGPVVVVVVEAVVITMAGLPLLFLPHFAFFLFPFSN